jgi:hypothetical protein
MRVCWLVSKAFVLISLFGRSVGKWLIRMNFLIVIELIRLILVGCSFMIIILFYSLVILTAYYSIINVVLAFGLFVGIIFINSIFFSLIS